MGGDLESTKVPNTVRVPPWQAERESAMRSQSGSRRREEAGGLIASEPVYSKSIPLLTSGATDAAAELVAAEITRRTDGCHATGAALVVRVCLLTPAAAGRSIANDLRNIIATFSTLVL